ncbi:hypothetical protein [Pseudoduganella chitinolytica]|uniref:Lipoprotein n=1 Tax=Pseudoduganella chitinolytica TaxID=34070 RepID=A0ABY8B4B9_9BURK|nr:hypothetical protein [Pseudoduganella chitinolytica]WEF30710.1 hypothetical protein PX653_14625 [Pseudoduganella chitinolytica]
MKYLHSLPLSLSALSSLVLLSGCAMMRNAHDPARDKQTVTVVNAMTWTNPLSGKRDGVRTAWPLAQLANHEEIFPLAQIKQCDGAQLPCRWGVLSASRSITRYEYIAGAVTLDLGLLVDVHRRQQDRRRNFHTSMAIPGDVPALTYRKTAKEGVVLPYGKVYRVEMEHGLRYEICAQRVDAGGRALDRCDIPYI